MCELVRSIQKQSDRLSELVLWIMIEDALFTSNETWCQSNGRKRRRGTYRIQQDDTLPLLFTFFFRLTYRYLILITRF